MLPLCAKIVNLPQVCILFAKDAQGQILDEKFMEGKGLKNSEALIPLALSIRVSALTTVPVRGELTGRQKYKGNKFPCQQTQTSVYLHALSQPKLSKRIDPL